MAGAPLGHSEVMTGFLASASLQEICTSPGNVLPRPSPQCLASSTKGSRATMPDRTSRASRAHEQSSKLLRPCMAYYKVPSGQKSREPPDASLSLISLVL